MPRSMSNGDGSLFVRYQNSMESRKLRPQSLELLGRELECEVGRESFGIALHLLIQPFGRAIQGGQP
jgi:hypothetical protein